MDKQQRQQQEEDEKVLGELDSKIYDILVDIQLNKAFPEVQRLLHCQLIQIRQRRVELARKIETDLIQHKKNCIQRELEKNNPPPPPPLPPQHIRDED